MTRQERDIAIARLQLPAEQRLAMPPALFRTISAEERQRMTDELRR